MYPQDNLSRSSELTRRSRSIKVLGIGGAGCNALDHMMRRALPEVHYTALNTDSEALARCAVEDQLVLGFRTTRGLGAGGDPDLGRAAAEEDLDSIRVRVQCADMVFLVAGLGGGTGTGAAPLIAQTAREEGALVLALVTLPFECEGRRRREQAFAGLEALQEHADAVIALPNQHLLRLVDQTTPLLEAFAVTHELIHQGIRSLWGMLTRPGVINLDFASLRTVAFGKDATSVFATAQAAGKDRARQVWEQLLAHPLLDEGRVLDAASDLLVCLTAGPDLTLHETEWFMSQINGRAGDATLLMGTTVDENYDGQLQALVIATQRAPASPRTVHGATPHAKASFDMHAPHSDRAHPASPAEAAIRESSSETAIPDGNGTLHETGSRSRGRSRASAEERTPRLQQGQLKLDLVPRGRFAKSERTIIHGEDLDVPTYIRKGIQLN